jgi:beta-N-acetylhexosaminidase
MLIASERCFNFSSFVACIFCLAFGLQTNAQTVEQRLEKMSPEEKVGQIMIWTFAGTEFTKANRDILARYKLGAYIAFSRNIKSIKQIAKFNSEAQAFAIKKLKAPLFLMIDQEGGSVTRVKVGTPIPSALALSHVPDAKIVEEFAKTNGDFLSTIGFNVNLAPVMDLSNPTIDTFIANRSFGDDPSEVSETAMAYARGISESGMIPTAKHFPGHGGVVADSHTGVAKKLDTLEELEARDWVPFTHYAAAEFPKAIMMAHMSLPSVDPSGVPATYSSVIIKDHLRGKLGYTGLIITDDLEMGGASISDDMGERAVRAFLAGNDMLMLAGLLKNQKKAYDAVLAAVKSGRISRRRLNESVGRILELKDRPRFAKVLFEEKKSREIKTKIESLSKQIMLKNFKDSLDSKSSQWPQIRADQEVLVMSADKRFYNHFSEYLNGKATFLRLSRSTMDQARSELTKSQYALVVYYASGSITAKWLMSLAPELRAKLIVVNCNHPGKIDAQDTYLSVLNLNSHSPEAGGWLARSLSAPPEMRLPASRGTQTSTEADDGEPAN